MLVKSMLFMLQAKWGAVANGSAKGHDLENGSHAVNGSLANGNAVKV